MAVTSGALKRSRPTERRDDVVNALKVDFMGIGAPKCGTTWLFYALGQHPKICLSEPKEIRYFNREDFGKPFVHGRDRLPLINPNHSNDIAWYARHYKHCPANMIKGEFTPQYLYDEEAPSLIHRHFPDVKLLVCLRKPVDQLHSHFFARTRYSRRDNAITFEEAIEQDPRYLLRAYYANHLDRFIEIFTRERIKVVLLEDIIECPEQTVRDVFDFLGVESEIDLDLNNVPKNRAKKNRLVSPEPVMRWFSSFLIEHDQAALLRKMRNLGLKKLLLGISTIESPREPLNLETQDRVSRLFHDDISELEVILDRDLTTWR